MASCQTSQCQTLRLAPSMPANLLMYIHQGFSVGCNQMAATTYISEIAPTRARGAALGFYQLFVSKAPVLHDIY